jgi:hypothetical protein
MWQTLRRLRAALGVWGWLGVVLFALMFWIIVVEDAKLAVSNAGAIMRVATLLVLGLVAAGMHWGTYSRSVETTPYQQVLKPLLESREEYCLLLRPFGSDGEVLVTYQPRGAKQPRWRYTPAGLVTSTQTLEQVVAAAAREALGVRAYAMVDTDLTLAPPGPVYLRAPHSEWKIPAGELIRRAHTIAVLLPPQQSLRAAMEWELQEIVRQQRQSRVVIVLPPLHRRRYDHAQARAQAAVLLAALEGAPGGLDRIPSRLVDAYLARLPERALVIKAAADGSVVPWVVEGGGRRAKVGSRAYADALGEAITANEREWAGRGFRARYGLGARPKSAG